jgi:hypothetical protein
MTIKHKNTNLPKAASYTFICALLFSILTGCGTSLQHRGKVTLTFPDQHTETRGAYWKLDLAAGKSHIDEVSGSYTNEFDPSGFMEDFRNKGTGIQSEGTLSDIVKQLGPLAQTAIQAYLARPPTPSTTEPSPVDKIKTLTDLIAQLQALGLLKGTVK